MGGLDCNYLAALKGAICDSTLENTSWNLPKDFKNRSTTMMDIGLLSHLLFVICCYSCVIKSCDLCQLCMGFDSVLIQLHLSRCKPEVLITYGHCGCSVMPPCGSKSGTAGVPCLSLSVLASCLEHGSLCHKLSLCLSAVKE